MNSVRDRGAGAAGGSPDRPLLHRILGAAWADMPEPQRVLHSVTSVAQFSGRAEVLRGRSLISRLVAWGYGFPAAAPDIPVTVTKSRNGADEEWIRDFAGRRFRSVCKAGLRPGYFRESFWPLTFEIPLALTDGALEMPVQRGWCLGIPIPTVLLPRSETREYSVDGVFHFDVKLTAPVGGMIVRYRGWLKPDADR